MYFEKNGKSVKAIAVIGISLFLCGSVVAYADVADPWPGPRPHAYDGREIASAEMPSVSFDIEKNGQMTMYFHFNSQCQYQYVVRREDSNEMVASGSGSGSKDGTEQKTFSYEPLEDGMISHYVLELSVTFQRPTRFGNKLSTEQMEKYVLIQKIDGADNVSIRPFLGE